MCFLPSCESFTVLVDDTQVYSATKASPKDKRSKFLARTSVPWLRHNSENKTIKYMKPDRANRTDKEWLIGSTEGTGQRKRSVASPPTHTHTKAANHGATKSTLSFSHSVGKWALSTLYVEWLFVHIGSIKWGGGGGLNSQGSLYVYWLLQPVKNDRLYNGNYSDHTTHATCSSSHSVFFTTSTWNAWRTWDGSFSSEHGSYGLCFCFKISNQEYAGPTVRVFKVLLPLGTKQR